MIPRTLLSTALIPGGGEMKLYSRGADHMILVDREELMSTRMSGSEVALAEMTAARLGPRRSAHWLVGGYGMGFTLRAALAALPGDARVTVVELVPDIIDWANGPMAALTGDSLSDRRVAIRLGDVADSIDQGRGGYDAILLDVDNGPDGLVRAANDRLYSPAGLAAARAALRPGGVLAIWSAGSDAAFARRLREAGFTVDEQVVRARAASGDTVGKGPRHVIWFATDRRGGALMDNITHTLAGAVLAQAGLKRASRLAMAGCLLGANAPDIDVFIGPLVGIPTIEFHRGPIHALFALPLLAAGIVAMLWAYDRWRPGGAGALPFRPLALFAVTLVAVISHSFLDGMTTYAIAILSPLSSRWVSADAVFIIDWVFLLLMGAGIWLSARRWRGGRAHAGRPAQVAIGLMLAYIAANAAESATVEARADAQLRQRGLTPTLVVASPLPLLFWRRSVAWRTADAWGGGAYDPAGGLHLDAVAQPLALDDPALVAARDRRDVAAFLDWARMPMVVTIDGHRFLGDQRFWFAPAQGLPLSWQETARRHSFLVPL